MRKIVLASASPRRKELLQNLGLTFDIVPSAIDEQYNGGRPEQYVMDIAYKKAVYVKEKCPNSLIIACDTTVVNQGKILGKPRNQKEALQMLLSLSGTKHRVLSGLTVLCTAFEREATSFAETLVYFSDLSQRDAENYLASGEPLDKAGAYAIQGLGSLFVKRIEGCYFNVVGLPVYLLGEMLASFDVNILSQEVINEGKQKKASDFKGNAW